VVAAGEHYGGPGLGNTHQGVVEKFDDVESRQGAIIDVTRNEDDVYRLRFHEGHELVHETALGFKHANAVE
jgi:hypothetical protein